MREEIGDLWHYLSQGFWIGIPSTGEVLPGGLTLMPPGLASVAALRFPRLRQELGALLTRSGNHVYAFHDYHVFTIPTRAHTDAPPDPMLLQRSADELLRYVEHLQLTHVYLPALHLDFAEPERQTVLAALTHRWDDRFILLTTH